MNINAYIQSGRMVAYAIRQQCTRNKLPSWNWRDTRDVGGVYDRLEDWMHVIKMEQGREVVSFKMTICSICQDSGVIPGDQRAPADNILRHDVPCPECQEI